MRYKLLFIGILLLLGELFWIRQILYSEVAFFAENPSWLSLEKLIFLPASLFFFTGIVMAVGVVYYFRNKETKTQTLLQTQIQHTDEYSVLVQFIDDLRELEMDEEAFVIPRSEKHLSQLLNTSIFFWEYYDGQVIPVGNVDRDLGREKIQEVEQLFLMDPPQTIFQGEFALYIVDHTLMIELQEIGEFREQIYFLPLYLKNIHLTLMSIRQRKTILNAHLSLDRKNQEMQSDLALATETQQAILPDLKNIDYLNIAALYVPHSGVSGDMYEKFMNREGDCSLFLGDVTGHGISAALITMMIRMGLTAEMHYLPPRNIMERLNTLFSSCVPENKFMTAVYLRITKAGQLNVCFAGHPPVIIIPAGGEVVQLYAPGQALGMFEEIFEPYQEESYQLKKGDRVFLHTDGITECKNVKKEEFGIEGLVDYLWKSKNVPLKGVVNGFLDHMATFSQGSSIKDDITLLGFEFLGDPSQSQG